MTTEELEIWKRLNELPDYIKPCAEHYGYSITQDGDVFSHKRRVKRIGHHSGTDVVVDSEVCVRLKIRLNNMGYPTVCLSDRDGGRLYFVHILVAKTFIPNPGGYNQVNHIDGNPKNRNWRNLEWCDQSHNMRHAARIGLIGGEKCNLAKLTKVTVLEIRKLAETNPRTIEIARLYGVHPDTIRMIKRRAIWKYI